MSGTILFLFIFVTSCGGGGIKQLPTDYPVEYYGFLNYGFTDGQIRYILTDLQIASQEGDTEKLEKYSAIEGEPAVPQAIELWNQGVRVVNIERFYRNNEPFTVIIDGKDVSIVGMIYDRTTSVSLFPKDVILTTDIPTPTPTATITATIPAPTALPVGQAVIQGYVGYGTEDSCPETYLYAEDTNGNVTSIHWDNYDCLYSITVPAPGDYIIYAWAAGDYSNMGLMYSQDCITPSVVHVNINDTLTQIVPGLCPIQNIPVP